MIAVIVFIQVIFTSIAFFFIVSQNYIPFGGIFTGSRKNRGSSTATFEFKY